MVSTRAFGATLLWTMRHRSLDCRSVRPLAAHLHKAALVCALASVACEGGASGGGTPMPTSAGGTSGIGGGAFGGTGPATAAELKLALPLNRLSNAEYDRSVRDLLKLDATELSTAPSSGFPADAIVEKYALGDAVSALSVERAESAAERLAQVAIAHADRLVSCDPAPTGEEACAHTFIAEFGRRAYRRELSDTDRAELFAQFQVGRANGDRFEDGISLVIQTALLSTYFLFHVPALDDSATGSVVDVVDSEMASRLSYFLWGSMPDDQLLAVAQTGMLKTTEQLKAQAERLLADPRAQDAMRSFLEQTFEPSKVAAINRDPVVYPAFSATTATSLADSYRSFLNDAYATGTFDAFFRSPKLFVNEELASLYGISGVSGASLVSVSAPATERIGILTQPGFLTLKGKFDRSDPIHRGVYIVKNLLCRALPDPPPNALAQPPDASLPQDTTRQQVEAKTAAAACRGCHGMINSFGFGLEGFDAIGRFRTQEVTTSAGALPIDSSGSTTLDSAAQPTQWSSAIELANAVASSHEARRCFAQNMYRFAHRRRADAQDDAEIDAITGDFITGGEALRTLVLRVIDSRAFTKRLVP